MKKFETLPLKSAAELLGRDIKSTKQWCESNGIHTYTDGKKQYIFLCELQAAWLTKLVFHLKASKGKDWQKQLKQYIQQ